MTDLMKQMEGIDEAALGSLRDAEKTGEGVRLPFEVAYFHWMNGKPNAKNSAKDTPALYFGGWAADQTKIGELVDSGAVPEYPAGFTAFEGAGDKGSWDGLCTRSLTISIIANRQRWVSADGRTSGPDFDRATGLTRRHLQMLTLAYMGGKPWGYAVLTAKGYQAQYLLAAVNDWAKAIAPFRKELNATQFPLSAFAITIGTKGDTPDFQSVGTTATSKITPIKAIIPEDLSAEKVSKRFIGAQNLRANAEHLSQAAEWLASWKQAANTQARATAPEDGAGALPEDSNW